MHSKYFLLVVVGSGIYDTELINDFHCQNLWLLGPVLIWLFRKQGNNLYMSRSVRSMSQYFWNFQFTCTGSVHTIRPSFIYEWILILILSRSSFGDIDLLMNTFKQLTEMPFEVADGRWTMADGDALFVLDVSNADVNSERHPIAKFHFQFEWLRETQYCALCIHYSIHYYYYDSPILIQSHLIASTALPIYNLQLHYM